VSLSKPFFIRLPSFRYFVIVMKNGLSTHSFFFVGLGFELKAPQLQGRHSTAWVVRLGWHQTILQFSASQVARITGVSHCAWLILPIWSPYTVGSFFFLLSLLFHDIHPCLLIQTSFTYHLHLLQQLPPWWYSGSFTPLLWVAHSILASSLLHTSFSQYTLLTLHWKSKLYPFNL
jgi:hypothetical protein